VGGALGQSLPFALGLALSPFPLVAMVLILSTPRGRANGIIFALSSISGVAAVGAIVLVLSGDEAASDSGAPADWVSWLRIALGLVLLAYGVRSLHGSAPGEAPAELPAWMRSLDTLTPGKAVGMGLLLSALNPKNLALAVAGSAAIAQAELPVVEASIALAVFVAVATLGAIAPLAIYLSLGDRGAAMLQGPKDWMVRNSDVVVAVLMLIFGAVLIGNGVSGLSA
jgi:threonine/homoserine/homoserine lactone efflux protein